ncbi:MAG: spondin domain-containing protein, partial [Pseudomonadota bacterium]
GQGFFTWATMVIPSNDAFLAVPDDALADPVFDEDGNFLGPVVIQRFGSDVLDAGTEVNTEENAAFLNQTARDQGEAEGGVITEHPGFNGSEGLADGEPVNILGGTTAPGAMIDPVEGDFTRNAGNEQLLEIVIDLVAGSDDTLIGGAGEDILDGGRGDDRLEGGTGADTFVFEADAGFDTVTDFEADADILDLSADVFGFESIDDVLGAASQEGDDVLIGLGDEGALRVRDLEVDQLTDDNVLF